MATIKSQMALNDGMSVVLKKITAALDTTLASFEQIQRLSGNTMDVAEIEAARGALADASNAVDEMADNYRRAAQEAQALKDGDFDTFLSLVNASGLSSALHLQNTWSVHDPRQQAIPLALAEAERLLDGGAVRVHGGGFAGTIQAWVPQGDLEAFKNGMEALLGQGKCHVLRIRPVGGCVVAE